MRLPWGGHATPLRFKLTVSLIAALRAPTPLNVASWRRCVKQTPLNVASLRRCVKQNPSKRSDVAALRETNPSKRSVKKPKKA
jgi:hypothetical protein